MTAAPAPTGDDSTIQMLLGQCRQVIGAKTTPDEAIKKIRAAMEKSPTITRSTLLDVLTALNAELGDPSSLSADVRRFLSQVTNELLPSDVLSLELNALGAEEQRAKSRMVKEKTRLYYKQVKYNLLREESEGYAKLVSELLAVKSETTAEQLILVIERLIGQFNIDPNRVIDLLLDCFECSLPHRELFLATLRRFKVGREELCSLLGMKFIFCHRAEHTPMDLYRLASLLCQEGMVDLLQLYKMLSPTSERLAAEHKELGALVKRRCAKAEIISSGQLATQSINEAAAAMQAMGDGNGNDNAQPLAAISFSAASACQDSEDAKITASSFDDTEVLAKNQKLGLACALLEHGAWDLAKKLLDRMPDGYAVQLSRRVSRALANLVGYAIEPFYRVKVKHWMDQPPESSKWRESWERFTHPVAQITKWEDLPGLIYPWLAYLGPQVALRHEVAIKLMRLLASYFEERAASEAMGVKEGEDKVSATIVDICDHCLVPGLSLLASPNYNYCDELWSILQRMPYQQRYYIYGRWKTIHTLRSWDLSVQRSKVVGMTRYAMKRLSKESAKVIGRQLGKLCHIYPAAALDYMLDKVQDFDNFIQPVVESMRFMSSMEFDVLAYCLIEALSAPSKEHNKTTDVAYSSWLQSLSSFTAAIFKRYQIDVIGLLQYIANQLKDGKNLDLIVLRDIVANCSGVESGTDLTQEHIDALGGGDLLKQETSFGSQAKTNKRAVTRLRDALLKSDLLESLCILIAQQKNFITYRDFNEYPLKLTTHMQDYCQETLVQFHQFIRWNIRPEDYTRRMPELAELIGEQFLPIELAMLLTRGKYLAEINEKYEASKSALTASADVKLDSADSVRLFKKAFDEVVTGLEHAMQRIYPESHWLDLTPRLYATFWLLSISDISAPVHAYEKEIEKCKRALAELLSVHPLPSDSVSRARRQAKDEERIRQHEAKLVEEMRTQMEHVNRVKEALAKDRKAFFSLFQVRRSQMLRFLQSCILPRVLFSEVDAVYCARFIDTLHANKTELFQTMVFFDKIFVDVSVVLAGLTEREAMCFGRFCALSLETIMRWYASEAVFRAECEGFPGCVTRVTSKADGHEGAEKSNEFTYHHLRSICFKWQTRLVRVFSDMLSAESAYVCVRNALTLMTKILRHFPLITVHYKAVEKAVTELRDREKEKRPDLNLLASSYLVKLAKRADVKLVETKDFADASKLRAANHKQQASSSQSAAKDDKGGSSSASRKRAAPTSTTAPTASANATGSKTPTTKSTSGGGGGGHSTPSRDREPSTRDTRDQSSAGSERKKAR